MKSTASIKEIKKAYKGSQEVIAQIHLMISRLRRKIRQHVYVKHFQFLDLLIAYRYLSVVVILILAKKLNNLPFLASI